VQGESKSKLVCFLPSRSLSKPSGSILLLAMYDMDGALYSYILRYSLVLARFWDFFNFFMKKDVKIFAGSKNVATFASAFEKTRFLQRLKVCNRGARNP
jgi:hypothetical protein